MTCLCIAKKPWVVRSFLQIRLGIRAVPFEQIAMECCLKHVCKDFLESVQNVEPRLRKVRLRCTWEFHDIRRVFFLWRIRWFIPVFILYIYSSYDMYHASYLLRTSECSSIFFFQVFFFYFFPVCFLCSFWFRWPVVFEQCFYSMIRRSMIHGAVVSYTSTFLPSFQTVPVVDRLARREFFFFVAPIDAPTSLLVTGRTQYANIFTKYFEAFVFFSANIYFVYCTSIYFPLRLHHYYLRGASKYLLFINPVTKI